MAMQTVPLLQTLIDARGLSMGDLADKAKITVRQLLKIRKGLAVASSPTCNRLAKVLKTDVATLRGALNDMRPKT